MIGATPLHQVPAMLTGRERMAISSDHAARRRHTEQRMTMPHIHAIEAARLRTAARAQGPDARIWRWYSEQTEEQRLECHRHEDIWSVKVAGRELARDRSFDAAVRTAYAFSRALQAV
jgi:hypothetical protein